MTTNIERRVDRRFKVDPVICNTVPRMRGLCVLRNVSLQGAFFMNQAPPPLGSTLKLEFSESPLHGYSVGGKVVRHFTSGHKGFAIEFLSPHPRMLRAAYYVVDDDW